MLICLLFLFSRSSGSLQSLGQLQCSVYFRQSLTLPASQRCLCVDILQARDLATQQKAMINPYIKLYLEPDEDRSSKQKTPHKTATVNPKYNQTFEYSVEAARLSHLQLHISVWSHLSTGNNACLGAIVFQNLAVLAQKRASSHGHQPVWYELKPYKPKPRTSRASYSSSTSTSTGALHVHSALNTALSTRVNSLAEARPPASLASNGRQNTDSQLRSSLSSSASLGCVSKAVCAAPSLPPSVPPPPLPRAAHAPERLSPPAPASAPASARTSVAAGKKFCPECGTKRLKLTSKFCHECGERL